MFRKSKKQKWVRLGPGQYVDMNAVIAVSIQSGPNGRECVLVGSEGFRFTVDLISARGDGQQVSRGEAVNYVEDLIQRAGGEG